MASPIVRRRTALMLAAIGGLVYLSVSLLGNSDGAFTAVELPDVAGLPVPVPQIEQRLPPAMPGANAPSNLPGVTP